MPMLPRDGGAHACCRSGPRRWYRRTIAVPPGPPDHRHSTALRARYRPPNTRWRADEHGHSAHLYVDALASLARIAPGIDVTRDEQMAHGVSVHRWNGPHGDLPFSPPADVVIEAFGCGLPPSYLNAMARRDPKP